MRVFPMAPGLVSGGATRHWRTRCSKRHTLGLGWPPAMKLRERSSQERWFSDSGGSADVVDQINRLIHPVALAQDGEELVHRYGRFVEPCGDGGNRPESLGRRDIKRVGCELARRDDLDAWRDLVLWEVLEVVCHDGARVSCDRGGEDMFVIEV